MLRVVEWFDLTERKPEIEKGISNSFTFHSFGGNSEGVVKWFNLNRERIREGRAGFALLDSFCISNSFTFRT